MLQKQYKEFPNTLHLVSPNVNILQIYSTVIKTRKLALATDPIPISSSSPFMFFILSRPGSPIALSYRVSVVSLAWDSTFIYPFMAFTLLKSTSQSLCRMCLNLGLSGVSSGCAFWQEHHRSDAVPLSVHRIRPHMRLMCCGTRYVDCDHPSKVGSARFSTVKVVFSPLLLIGLL